MLNKSYLSIYAKSFSWAGFFLPKKTLKKCSTLYDFCRVADNIADDLEELVNKEKKFNQFENDFNNKKFNDPVIKNMWGLMEEFNISVKIVQDLLIGIKSDKFDKTIFSLIIGGALGNFYDRITFKAVPDFIDFHYGNFHWFTFNAADIFITIGIICFIMKEIFIKDN